MSDTDGKTPTNGGPTTGKSKNGDERVAPPAGERVGFGSGRMPSAGIPMEKSLNFGPSVKRLLRRMGPDRRLLGVVLVLELGVGAEGVVVASDVGPDVPPADGAVGADVQPGSGGIILIDGTKHTASKIDVTAGAKAKTPFANCPGPLDPAKFSAHGLNIIPQGSGKARLFVVGHGGREAIEVFDVPEGFASITVNVNA